MFIEYDARTMSTGVRDIDEQHKELIRRLNTLLEAMKQGKGKAEIESLTGFLGEYAAKHFGHEEECMDRYRCPAAAANKQAHAYFISLFESFRDRINDKGADVSLVIEAQRELVSWVKNHIMRVDVQLNQCIKTMPGAAVAGAGMAR